MNIKNTCDSRLWPILLSVPFLAQLFALERHRNGFLEYDLHFFPVALLLLVSFLFYRALKRGSAAAGYRLNILDLLVILAVVYLTLQYLSLPRISGRDICFCWLWLVLFFCFKYSPSYFSRLPIGLAFVLIAVFSLQITDVQLFPTLFFSKDASLINPGENANYYATASPFLLSQLIGKTRVERSRSLTALFGIALGACAYFTCGARTAGIAGSVDVIFIAIPAFAKKAPLVGKVVLILIVLAGVTLLAKYLYHRNTDSVQGRLLIYKVSLQMAASNPATGHGFGRFGALYSSYQANYIKDRQPPMAQQIRRGAFMRLPVGGLSPMLDI